MGNNYSNGNSKGISIIIIIIIIISSSSSKVRRTCKNFKALGTTCREMDAFSKTARLGDSSKKPEGQRKMPPNTLKRENSLKMDTIFVLGSSGTTSGAKKKFDASVMSMSGTSLSLGDLGAEDELNTMFDNSMKLGGTIKSP